MPARFPLRTAVLLPLLASVSARAQAPLLELTSPEPERRGFFGSSASGVPDADGDGRGDLLVGAANDYSFSGKTESRAHLYSGATGQLLHTLDSPDPDPYSYFSGSVSGVPDTDGDGRGDVLVGAQGEVVGDREKAGRAHLYSGATGGLLHTLISPDPVVRGYFGRSVSGVGDVDGDGRGDLLVGASEEDPGPSPDDAGRAYVFSGASGTLLRTLRSPDEEEGGEFGNAVSGVPDADGDGVDDLLVGADEEGDEPGAGRVYLFSGATGALLHELANPGPEDYFDYFGWSVAGVPDTDGDGRGDLLIGTLSAERAHLYSGATGQLLHTLWVNGGVAGVPDTDGDGRGDLLISNHLYSGATGALLRTLESPNPEPIGLFGSSAAGVPDADGDGRGDLLIGAQREDVGDVWDAGRAYLFSGSETSTVPPLALTLTPTAPPRPVVVPQGGRVRFDATFDVAPYGPSEVEFWTVATRPDGSTTGPLIGPSTLLLTPGTSVTLALQQGVGRSSALGEYTYTMYAGTYPFIVLASDTEPATVVAATAGVGTEEEWRAYDGAGAPLGAGAVLDLRQPANVPMATEAPGAFALWGPTPNPAVGRATLRLDLPEAVLVRVALYDLLGREVASVDTGTLSPGAHDVVLDVSALPSGMYAWRLAAGAHTETGRLAIVR